MINFIFLAFSRKPIRKEMIGIYKWIFTWKKLSRTSVMTKISDEESPQYFSGNTIVLPHRGKLSLRSSESRADVPCVKKIQIIKYST